MRIATWSICAMVWVVASPWLQVMAGAELPKQAPTPESLRQTKAHWEQDMFSADPAERIAVIDEMYPSRKDVEVLFPEQAAKLARLVELVKIRMKKRIESVPDKELQEERGKRTKILGIETFNVRKDDPSRRFATVLKVIPPEVPVYRIIVSYEKGGAGSSSYLFVNGRWVHFQGLESIPEILPKLDEMLKQAEGAK